MEKLSNEINHIWADFHKELKGFIYKKTKNLADSEDILQESFIKIIQNIDKVKQAKNLRQYLYAIVSNLVHDYFRNKKENIEGTDFFEQFSEEESLFLNEKIAQNCIKPFIHKLPKNYKEALLMTEFENISQKELAQKLNISYSGAKSRVQRGKEKLKELILNCCAFQADIYGNLREQTEKNCNCS